MVSHVSLLVRLALARVTSSEEGCWLVWFVRFVNRRGVKVLAQPALNVTLGYSSKRAVLITDNHNVEA